MRTTIVRWAGLGLAMSSSIAIAGAMDTHEPNLLTIAPTVIEVLANGPLPDNVQHSLLLLTEEERVTLRGLLLERMSEEEITARRDIYEVVGPPEGDVTSAKEVNNIGREQMYADGDGDGGVADGWQLYVYVPFYSQNDGAWSGKGLGYNYCGNSTIGRYGCHLTCISMLYAKWGFREMSPPGLNDWRVGSEAHYAFNPDKNTCGDLIRLPQALQYMACRPWRYINNDEIYGQLQAGHPIVANTDQYGFGNHFVVIFGFDGARYWVKDPVKDWTTQDQPLSGYVKNRRLYGYP